MALNNRCNISNTEETHRKQNGIHQLVNVYYFPSSRIYFCRLIGRPPAASDFRLRGVVVRSSGKSASAGKGALRGREERRCPLSESQDFSKYFRLKSLYTELNCIGTFSCRSEFVYFVGRVECRAGRVISRSQSHSRVLWIWR